MSELLEKKYFHNKIDEEIDYLVERIINDDDYKDTESFEDIFDNVMSNAEYSLSIGKEVCRRLGKAYPW